MTENFDLSDWITTTEAAELTGYTTARFRQLAKAGTVVAQKLGRDWFMNKDSVLDWAAEMKRLGAAKHNPQRTATYD